MPTEHDGRQWRVTIRALKSQHVLLFTAIFIARGEMLNSVPISTGAAWGSRAIQVVLRPASHLRQLR
jgi:hypothetical protein